MELGSVPFLLEPAVGTHCDFTVLHGRSSKPSISMMSPGSTEMGKMLHVCPGTGQSPFLPPPTSAWLVTEQHTWAVSVSCSIHRKKVEMPGCCCVSSCGWIPLDFVGSRAISPCVDHVALIGLVESPRSCVFPRVCCCQTSFYPPHPSSSFVNPWVWECLNSVYYFYCLGGKMAMELW